MPGRTGQQCAQRWRHKVNPNIRKDKWTEAEDRQVRPLPASVDQSTNRHTPTRHKLDSRRGSDFTTACHLTSFHPPHAAQSARRYLRPSLGRHLPPHGGQDRPAVHGPLEAPPRPLRLAQAMDHQGGGPQARRAAGPARRQLERHRQDDEQPNRAAVPRQVVPSSLHRPPLPRRLWQPPLTEIRGQG